MVLERLYPNEIDLNAKGSNFWASEWGSWTYAPLVGTLNYLYNNTYNCRVRSDVIDTELTKIKFRGSFTDATPDFYIQIYDATGVTGLKSFYYSSSTSGKDFNETYDISDINEPFIIKLLSYGPINKKISISEFKLTN